jgi:hypothetical protein
MNNLVHCSNCGWVHFTVTADYVREWEADWLRLFNEKDKKWLSNYGITDTPPSTDKYLHCFRCGESYKTMLDGTPPNFGDGHTIQPILQAKDSL